MKKILLVFCGVILMSGLFAQERIIKGKVMAGDDASALPGVHVIVKGLNSRAVTDLNGYYTLSVPAFRKNILVFSFIGLKTVEVQIGGRNVIDISLKGDIALLSQVHVVGHEGGSITPILVVQEVRLMVSDGSEPNFATRNAETHTIGPGTY